jgi:hypothetical protein
MAGIAALTATIEQTPAFAQEIEIVPVQEAQKQKEPAEKKEQEQEQEGAKEDDSAPMLETDATSNPPGPREVRLQLWDGSVLTGDLGIDSIHIETKFGMLEVPVSNIQFLRPGLESIPELNEKLKNLLNNSATKSSKLANRLTANYSLWGCRFATNSGPSTMVEAPSERNTSKR